MNALEKQLDSIQSAYRAGRKEEIVEQSDQTWQNNLQGRLDESVSAAEQELLAKCSRYRSVALGAARQGKYTLADYLFEATERVIQTSAFSPAGLLVASSTHEAAVAYLDYRRGLYERGTERLYRALAMDEELEEKYGYTAFHIHRLRLLLNLVRLKRRQGKTDEVLHLAFALADYLEQKIISLPFPTSWDSHRLEGQPPMLTNFMFEQAIIEIMFLLAGHASSPEQFLLRAAAHTSSEAQETCSLSSQSHLWLQARLALHARDDVTFLSLVQPLVLAGPGKALWFWYGTLMDLLLLCKDLPLEPALLLTQEIMEDVPTWPWSHLPPAWRTMLQQSSLQHTFV